MSWLLRRTEVGKAMLHHWSLWIQLVLCKTGLLEKRHKHKLFHITELNSILKLHWQQESGHAVTLSWFTFDLRYLNSWTWILCPTFLSIWQLGIQNLWKHNLECERLPHSGEGNVEGRCCVKMNRVHSHTLFTLYKNNTMATYPVHIWLKICIVSP